ncbi:EAL domain-containing protein [Marinobacteraceae bacterium S3BR75-40.1]
MTLWPRSFRFKVLLTLLALVVASQLIIGAMVVYRSYQEVEARARDNLQTGSRVVHQVMQNRVDQLLDSVRVLADDFGFKTAVATGDKATIATVLANHGARVEADLVMLADNQGELIASSHHDTSVHLGFPFPDLWHQAQQEGGAASVVLLDRVPYHFVMVPVRAPDRIGWVGMGFRLDQTLAERVKRITELNVVFAARDKRTLQPVFAVTTLPPEAPPIALTLLPSQAESEKNLIDTEAYLGMRVSLTPTVDTWLMESKQRILSGFRRLQQDLLVIFSVLLVLSCVAAIAIARMIRRPVTNLAAFAHRIGAGEDMDSAPVAESGELGELARTLTDMQRRIRQREQRIRHHALHDSLTGLPNRTALEQKLKQRLADGEEFPLLRFSIREFKEINDTLGYQFGDQLLQSVATRVRAFIGGNGVLARVGGNEFIALPEYQGDLTIEALITFVERLRRQVENPITLMDSPILVHLEIGVLRVPRDASSMKHLWRRSSIVLNRSRDREGHLVCYEPGMDESHLRELTLIRDLEPALEQGQLFLAFQPKVRLDTAEVTDFEVLARWVHPELGFVPPDEFITLAERSGQIGYITDWVLRTVFDTLNRWWLNGHHYGLAVNLSAHDLMDSTLGDKLKNYIDRSAAPPEAVTLEVTESAVMRDTDLAVNQLTRMRRVGFKVAIDDYGTGYASLGHLKNLPADKLKIDKSFILRLAENHEDQMIVRSTIKLGHGLGLSIVAEGIEDRASWDLLQAAGCDTAQGYFIAKPFREEELDGWLAEFAGRQAELRSRGQN